jgi:flagellar hook assembly protein FlgD
VVLEAFRIEAFRAVLRPNPFQGATTLHLALPEPGPVTVSVYDIRGRRIRILEEGFRGAGEHLLVWDGRDDTGQRASAGLYFFRIRAGGRQSVQKIVLTP